MNIDQQTQTIYIPLLISDQILNKEFNAKLNSQVTTKPIKLNSKTNLGASIGKVAKVINPLTKGKKSQLQLMIETEMNQAD